MKTMTKVVTVNTAITKGDKTTIWVVFQINVLKDIFNIMKVSFMLQKRDEIKCNIKIHA